jgi:hypothetical protein
MRKNRVPDLDKTGRRLPDNPQDLNCWNFFLNLFYCQGPRGNFQAYYSNGHLAKCERERLLFVTCMRIRWFKTIQPKEEILQEAKEKLKEPMNKYPPVWTLRSEPPPNFHTYLTLSQAEKDKIFMEAMQDILAPTTASSHSSTSSPSTSPSSPSSPSSINR